jgi:hypothetical protein
MNSRKREHQDVLDPFTLQHGWFLLDFPSLQVRPNPGLSQADRERVCRTIARLKLNDYKAIDERKAWLEAFKAGAGLGFLRKRAPFLAHELERQQLLDTVHHWFAGLGEDHARA